MYMNGTLLEMAMLTAFPETLTPQVNASIATLSFRIFRLWST